MYTATKTARLEARVSFGLSKLIERAAEIEGLSMTSFITSVLQKEAERIIQAQEIIRLSLGDQERFAESILNPPEPTDALRKAFASRHNVMGVD